MRTARAAVLLLFLASGASASDFDKGAIGSAGSEFLVTDVGARGIALGGAYSALTSDAYSLYWNPAGLSKIPRLSLAGMTASQAPDIRTHSAAYAQRVNEAGVLGFGVRYQDIGTIPHTDISGNDLGTFHPRNYIAEVGWGQSVYDLSDSEVDVAMGVTARWLHSDILLHANSYTGDIGIQSRFYKGKHVYDLGFAVQNIGVGQKFDQKRDTLPFRARVGGAMHPVKPLSLSVEAIMPLDNVVYGAFGAEYLLEAGRNVKAALRGGFNSLTIESLGVPSTLSAGMGIMIGDLTFDFAYTPMGVLGTGVGETYKVSVSFNLPAKTSRRYRER